MVNNRAFKTKIIVYRDTVIPDKYNRPVRIPILMTKTRCNIKEITNSIIQTVPNAQGTQVYYIYANLRADIKQGDIIEVVYNKTRYVITSLPERFKNHLRLQATRKIEVGNTNETKLL